MPRRRLAISCVLAFSFACGRLPAQCGELPALPAEDATVAIPAQEWPYRPGPRTIDVHVRYPGGASTNVDAGTGLMLSLHNWGGSGFTGTADPRRLADEFNVVAIGVDYLQTGRPSIEGPEPYDFGWLQALDALRALHYVRQGLREKGVDFADGRTFATGGSGGGNVALMANKLAPRTFACVVDICGMKKLSDDVAYNQPEGSDLDARYSPDPRSRNYLTADEQLLRFVGNPRNLVAMREQGASAKIVVVHGRDDATCPFSDAEEAVLNLRQAGCDVDAHFIGATDLDGLTFTGSGHALGDRTQIVFHVAERYLRPDGPQALSREGPSDFDLRQEIRYATPNGAFVVSYAQGPPVGRFDLAEPPHYAERADLTYYLDDAGERRAIASTEDWEVRRKHLLLGLQAVMGPLPAAARRVPLEVETLSEERVGEVVRRKISYQSELGSRVPAWLLLPVEDQGKRPAMLCLHQTFAGGKDEPAGIAGNLDLHYALHLAQRGYVTLAPDYPSLGEHDWDFNADDYDSGSMKAIWDNIRAVDLLESLAQVDGARIGVLGHSLGGHNALFTAVFEPRLKAVVSSCGFCTLHKDDVPSWTGERYMPRIETVYGNDAARLPFDFTEIVAALAPRPFLACAAERDDDFDAGGVRDVLGSARPVYELHSAADCLEGYYPDAPHSFPADARQRAYEFLDRALMGD